MFERLLANLKLMRWSHIRQLTGGAAGYWMIHELVHDKGRPVCIDQIFLGILCVTAYMIIEAVIRATMKR